MNVGTFETSLAAHPALLPAHSTTFSGGFQLDALQNIDLLFLRDVPPHAQISWA